MDEATKKAIADGIKEGIADATVGLKDKNKDLLGKLKKATENLNVFGDVTPEDLTKLRADAKKLADFNKKQQEKDGEYKTLYETQQTQHETETAKLKEDKQKATDDLTTVKKESALSNAIRAAKIDPLLHEAAVALHETTVALNDDGEAMIGDKTVQEAVTAWTETDVGKRFVSDGHSGGGADGPGGKTVPEAAYFDKKSEHFSVTKQATVANKSPELYAKLKKQASAK